MKKYLYIIKSEMMSSLQYIRNILFGTIGYFIMIFIFFQLWSYIYNDPSELINGYTKSQMIWYIIFTEILWSVSSCRSLNLKIIEDIKTGNIAYNLNKPYNYIEYVVSNHFGSVILKAIVYTIVGAFLGIIMIGNIPKLTILQALIVLVVSLIGVLINFLLVTFISFTSFIIEDSRPLFWLYSKMILILGVMFPVEYFPTKLQPIIKACPIFVINYGPAKLFVDFSYEKAMEIIAIQAIYLAIAIILSTLMYRKGVRKLNVNGG